MEIGLILLGWFCGVAINYLADVLPARQGLRTPRCQTCGEKYSCRNYLLGPRRCYACGSHRGWRSWLLELGMIAAALCLWYYPPQRLGFWAGIGLLAYLMLVVIIDLEHHLILHPINLIGMVIGLAAGSYQRGILASLYGWLAGLAIMMILYLFGNLLMGWLSRRRGAELTEDALGFGDVLFGGVMGGVLGWPGVVAGVALAIMLGGIVSLVTMVVMAIRKRYQSNLAIAYGPYLVASCIFYLYVFGYLANP